MLGVSLPNLTPDFIQIFLPDYIKNIQEFNTGDYYQISYQTTAIGYRLKCEYSSLNKAEVNQFLDFYHLVKHENFTIPTGFLKHFKPSLRNQLTIYPFWEFSAPITQSPTIINRQYFKTKLSFEIRSVFS